MGCGKTSVGRALGALLSWDVIDLDEEVEKYAGMTVPDIFATKGEAGFRSAEKKVLEDILSNRMGNVILALGGGTVKDEENASALRRNSKCVYLRASAGNLADWLGDDAQRNRPLLHHKAEVSLAEHISSLLAEREPQYLAVAEYIVDVNELSYGEAACKIKEMLSI